MVYAFPLVLAESCDAVTDLTIIDMLHFSLEHADKNLRCKSRVMNKVWDCDLYHYVFNPFCCIWIYQYSKWQYICCGMNSLFFCTVWRCYHITIDPSRLSQSLH